VTATLFGGGQSRAVYREGFGCYLEYGEGPVDAALPPAESETRHALLPEIARGSLVEAANPDLRLALDRAFAEPDRPPLRRTKAVVVVKDGQVIAERYAAGYGIDTPMLGYSATKSVTSALIGILVRQGKLAVNEPAQSRRGKVLTILAMRSRSIICCATPPELAMGSSLNASLASAFDRVNRMKYVERDMAGFAENSELESAPGSVWNYHDGNTIILSRLIRDAAGGHAADVRRLAQAELFDPLGMRRVTLEFDSTGTPEGSSQMLAPARDWARFGLLYLNDGVIGGRRILPRDGSVIRPRSPQAPGRAREPASGPTAATARVRGTVPRSACRAMPSMPAACSGNTSSSCRPNDWSSRASAFREINTTSQAFHGLLPM